MATPVRRRQVLASSCGEGSINASTQRKERGMLQEEHKTNLSVPTDGLPEHPAYVKIGLGMTINLENYESLRVDAHVSLPCGISDAEIIAAKARVASLALSFIEEERDKALGQDGITSR